MILKNKLVIIAEAGVNHNGSIKNAIKLIDTAKEARADFIKFQSFKSGNLVIKKLKKCNYQLSTTEKNETQYEMLKRYELTETQHKTLIKYCKKRKINFLTSPFDLESIDLVKNLKLKFIKIPSGEITNYPYLKKLSFLDKIFFLSTGMSNLNEIEAAIKVLISEGNKKSNIYVLHCNTEYPTPLDDVNLNVIKTIKKKITNQIGYSDHTEGSEVAIGAVALGCKVIEKHITLNKKMKGPDHKASMEPEEFKKFVIKLRNIKKALGSHQKQPSKSEKKNIKFVRKSIYASKKILKNEVFNENNIIVKRPYNGVNPMKIKKLYGKKAIKNYAIDELIKI